MKSELFISVIMPALNEELSIASAMDNTLDAFEALGLEGEVIVIDDGSTDNTLGLVNQKIARDKRIRVVTHAKPMGIGSSFWDGVDNAKGDIVTMIPGDNENEPKETLQYVGLLEYVDMVIPFTYNKNIRSLSRNLLSFIYRFIINTTFMTTFNYTNSTIIYRKSILKQLGSRLGSFFFQTDILIRLVKRGYLFAEVPYRLGLRKAGKSKAISLPSLLQVLSGYLNLVKDIYFKNKDMLKDCGFAEDSASSRRL